MSYKVIDISEHNASIDFNKLDVDAVILRAGYRGYGDSGSLITDKKFKQYTKAANKIGIPVGVYFYSQAITSAEARAEAKYVINLIKDYRIDLPVYFDVEYAESKGNFVGRLYKAKLSKDKLTKIAKAFCDTVLVYGYEAGVYANYDFFKNKLNTTRLKAYSLWIAHYSVKEAPKVTGAKFDMWQYTNDGKPKGVTGMADMNRLYKDFIWREYKTTANLNCRKTRDLSPTSIESTLKKGTSVLVKSGSEKDIDGCTWVVIKKSPDDMTHYVVKQYLRRV